MRISYLPDDLLALVLVRLPPKTLGRFKSVSKSWNALISSPEFIKMHKNQPRINKNLNIIVKKIDGDRRARTTSGEIHVAEFSIVGEKSEFGCEIQQLHHPFESLHIGRNARIVGSCNGLLCQIFGRNGYWEYGITLCNPLIKSSWNLPKRPGLVNEPKKMSRRSISCYGFGYDDVHDDYKVMIASSRPYYDTGAMNIQEYEYEYEVYSLTSDSWSTVRSYLDSRIYSLDCPYSFLDGVLVNGALHWILRNKYKNSILAFDLRTDQHKILPVPEVLEENIHLRLSGLNGCLVLSYHRSSCLDLWVMKDYGLKNSVNRIPIYNLPSFSLRTPVAFFRDSNNRKRKIIFYDSFHGGLMLLYDCVTRQAEQFPAPSGYSYAKQFQFVGSLVQPYPPSNNGDTSLYREPKKYSFFRRSQRLEEVRKRKRN